MQGHGAILLSRRLDSMPSGTACSKIRITCIESQIRAATLQVPSLPLPAEHNVPGDCAVVAARGARPNLGLHNGLAHRERSLLEVDVVQSHRVVVDRRRVRIAGVKLGPCICEGHWDLPMAPEGINMPLSQKLLRRLEVASV